MKEDDAKKPQSKKDGVRKNSEHRKKRRTEKEIIIATFAENNCLKWPAIYLESMFSLLMKIFPSQFHCNLSIFEPYWEPEISNSQLCCRGRNDGRFLGLGQAL